MVLLPILTVLSISVQAQVKASFDSVSILIGSQTTLTISGTSQYPTTEELSQDGLVALEQWYDTIDGNILQRTTITSFDEGDHFLRYTPDDSLLLTVNDVANVDTTSLDIKDIAGLMEEPYTFWEIFRWILLAMGIAALIAGGIWLARYIIRKRRENQPIIPMPKAPQKPADQRALDALEALRTKQLWQQGKLKEYHTDLTDILRQFLEECYAIPSTEMTSDQTLDAFESTRTCTTESKEILRRILLTADMVKFAKSEPLPHEHDRSMSDAKAFVMACHESDERLAAENNPKTKES